MPFPDAKRASLCVDDSLAATCEESALESANGLMSIGAAIKVGFEEVRTRSARAGTEKAMPISKAAAKKVEVRRVV